MPVPAQPYINIQNGSATGTIQRGQPFSWYNPTNNDVLLKNCGTWCGADSYLVPANGSVEASVLSMPNAFGYAFTQNPNAWNVPGQPHISAPTMPEEGDETAEQEVA